MQANRPTGTPRKKNGMTKRVLIADDDPDLTLPLEYLVRHAGYEVNTVADGETALQYIAESMPDILLLDLAMPRRNGYEVCETVRANPAWAALRILVLSARCRAVEREKALALGADAYLVKPFSGRAVLEQISRWAAT